MIILSIHYSLRYKQKVRMSTKYQSNWVFAETNIKTKVV